MSSAAPRRQARRGRLGQGREAVARDVVGDPERLARQAFEEVAGDRLLAARSRSSGRSRRSSARPRRGAANRRVDLGVVGDVAVEHELRAELGGELGDPLLEALALVAEGQLGAFAAAGAGDAVGDRAVRQHAGDQEALAGEKSHGGRFRELGRATILACARGAPEPLDSAGDLSLFEGADTIPLFPRKRQVGGSSGPFFLADRLFDLLLLQRRSVDCRPPLPRMSQHTVIETTVAGLGYELVDGRARAGRTAARDDRPSGGRRRRRSASSPSTTARGHAPAAARARGRGLAYERLEVSSPGLDRPLKNAADFRALRRRAGRSDAEGAVQGPQALPRRADVGRGDGWRLVLAPTAAEAAAKKHAASRSAQARAAAAGTQRAGRSGRRREGARLFPRRGARGAARAGDRFQGAPVRRPAGARRTRRARNEEADGGRIQ